MVTKLIKETRAMNPRNKILEKRGLDHGHSQAQPGPNKKFVFENSQNVASQPPRELDPVMQQKLEYYNSPHMIRTTSTVFPESFNLCQRAALPCGIIVQPFLNVA